MSLCKLGMLTHLSAQSEISQLDMVVLVDENVGWLDVSVQHSASFTLFVSRPVVAILQSQEQLICYFPNNILGNGLNVLFAHFKIAAEITT